MNSTVATQAMSRRAILPCSLCSLTAHAFSLGLRMAGYTHLWQSILTSSLWDEDSDTRVLFITMLALADREGYVAASVPGLAHMARLSRTKCDKALLILCSPDPDSRSPDLEGRRLTQVDGGWLVVNFDQYREAGAIEENRKHNRERKAAWRAKNKVCPRDVPACPSLSHDVPESHTPDTAPAPAPEKKKTAAQSKKKGRFTPPTLSQVSAFCKANNYQLNAQFFCDHYAAKGWKMGKTPMVDWEAAVRAWVQRDRQTGEAPREQPPLVRGKDGRTPLERVTGE